MVTDYRLYPDVRYPTFLQDCARAVGYGLEHAAELGELFAKPAAVAVHNAQILADALALSVQLQAALHTRPVIDQAIGLIRGRTGRSAQDAFAQLRALSQSEHRKLVDVAQHIVDEAVRRARARARHDPESPIGVT